jgi:hypothetical protein
MKSQNGWAALTEQSRLLYTWTVPGDGTRLRLRQGFAGFLLIHLATRFDRKVEDLKEPLLDDWGYAFRPIRGFVALSNHASGTAMDLNATDHPLGRENTFSPDDERRIQSLLKKYDGCIRWGGNYNGRKDEMHMELDKDRAAAAVVARELAVTPRGREILRANPGQERIILGRR